MTEVWYTGQIKSCSTCVEREYSRVSGEGAAFACLYRIQTGVPLRFSLSVKAFKS